MSVKNSTSPLEKRIIELEDENKRLHECTDPQKLDQKSNDWEVGIFMAKHSFEFKKKVV